MAAIEFVDKWCEEHAGPAMTGGQAMWWARRINAQTTCTATVQTVEERGLQRFGWISGYVVLVQGLPKRHDATATTLCTSKQASNEFHWLPKKAER